MSNLSRKSTSQIGDRASKKQSLQSRVSSKILRDAKSFQSKMRIQQPKLRPYAPEEAVRLIEQGRLRRTIIRDQGGLFSRARNVDEEALETENIRIHTEEDQPAAIQVEDDEFVAYYDEQTGCHYDGEGNFIQITNPDEPNAIEDPYADDEVVTTAVEEYKDLRSYTESQVAKKSKKLRPKTAVSRTKKIKIDSQRGDRNNAYS